MKKPVIVVTMGDPAGIGPEIALKLFSENKLPMGYRYLFTGSPSVYEEMARHLGLSVLMSVVKEPEDAEPEMFSILETSTITPSEFTLGVISPLCGKAAYDSIVSSIDLALEGRIAAVVTNPIHKEALHQAGISYPGHTEIFAERTNTANYSMMFVLGELCVTHVTTHCSLKEAIALIDTTRVYNTITLMNQTLKSLGYRSPNIAVSGLNPHAGEGGLFGSEEIEHIIPAIKKASAEGIVVTGPYPPDTVFMRGFTGEFNGIVSMLHDHGFVALKSRDFDNGVNITAGLPIIRTSVGHGTAFDIAGKGIASTVSLKAAIDAACRMAALQ